MMLRQGVSNSTSRKIPRNTSKCAVQFMICISMHRWKQKKENKNIASGTERMRVNHARQPPGSENVRPVQTKTNLLAKLNPLCCNSLVPCVASLKTQRRVAHSKNVSMGLWQAGMRINAESNQMGGKGDEETRAEGQEKRTNNPGRSFWWTSSDIRAPVPRIFIRGKSTTTSFCSQQGIAEYAEE